jgi:hypothetical protein
MKPVGRAHIRAALRETGALLAQWTEGWDTEPCDWWYVCCDRKDYDISSLRKVARYDVRRGLQQCEVRKVDAEWFASNGFTVYAAAFRHYGTRPALTETEFVDEFRTHATYPGRETWGAFMNDRLIAWESCIVIDDAVVSASAKCDPAYFRARPNNALVYVLTRHYLIERRLRYVTSGSRVLLHDTNVQEFNEKMGYRKVYCPLRTELGSIAAFLHILRLPGLARRLGLGQFLRSPIDKLEAVAAAVRVSRSCQSVAASTAESYPRPGQSPDI